MTGEEARARLEALGLEPDAVRTLLDHFEDAERRGKTGHGLSRVAWLESQEFDPRARPERLVAEEGFERWHGRGALGYLVLDEIVRATLALATTPCARRGRRTLLPDGSPRLLGSPARRRWARRRAHHDLTAPPAAPVRRPAAHGYESARDRRSLE